MIFKKSSIPQPSRGYRIKEKDQVVPDQSMSLKEILTRFTRSEPLPVGHNGSYGSDSGIDPESDSPFNIDLEKARHMDLTEKDDFKELVAQAEAEHKAAEQKKAETGRQKKAEKDKAEFEKRVRMEARKLAKKAVPPGPSI